MPIHQIHVLVARKVTKGLERGGHVTERFLELLLRPEGKPANIRMQTVGADHQIEPAFSGTFELNPHAVGLLLQTDDLVVE